MFCRDSCAEDVKPPVCPDMDIVDNTQCKFNLSSFKMVFVVNSDSYMYKKQALKRAKQVSSFYMISIFSFVVQLLVYKSNSFGLFDIALTL